MQRTSKSPSVSRFRRWHGSFTLSLLIVWTAASATSIYGQEDIPHYELDEVVVTASRIPTAWDQLARSVVVFRRDDLARMPVRSLPELLEYAAGIDVRQRGTDGVQADISIRGGTFEQTLVVIDGVPLRNSQTGHHNMDLPLTIDDIERVEVLKGPGARAYGSNAYGGVVNIITRSGSPLKTQLSATAGQFGLKEGRISHRGPLLGLAQRISLARKISSGYIPDSTDFDITTVAYGTTLPLGGTVIDIAAGYTRKDFGAYMFYSDRFPHQREQTRTGYLQAATRLQAGNIQLSPVLYRHSHTDTFNIQIGDTWLQNAHRTVTSGGEVRALVPLRLGTAAFGVEVSGDDILSSNLGDHRRTTTGLYGEYRLESGTVILSSGLNAQWYSDWDWQVWPGVDALVRLSSSTILYGSAGRAYRIPTYTELYYVSPANLGNRNLRPESSWTWELGLRWRGTGSQAQLALFSRWGRDIIDWVRAADLDPWKADNISRIQTSGLDFSAGISPAGRWLGFDFPRLQLGYTYLQSDLDTRGLQSKYVLDHLKHQLILALTQRWLPRLEQDIRVRYEDRLGGTPFWLVDTKISLTLGRITGFVEITNLLDTGYTEAGYVPMPGRWLRLGLQADLLREP